MFSSEKKIDQPSKTPDKGARDANAFFQPRLSVNRPGDHYEQEADRVADRVMGMPASDQLQHSFFRPAVTSLQRKCQPCEEEQTVGDAAKPATPVTPAQPAPAPATPAPKKPVAPTIISETVVAKPDPRNRTKVGVGEEVNLTYSTGDVKTNWVSPQGVLSATKGVKVLFTAPDTAQKVKISAGAATIEFEVLAPTDVFMEPYPGTGIKHIVNVPNFGIETQPYLLPDSVNFNKVIYHEVDVFGTVSSPGIYACNPTRPAGHCLHQGKGPCGDLFLKNEVVASKGTKSVIGDCVYSGQCGTQPPDIPGTITLSIPYEYKIGNGKFHFIKNVTQTHALEADGVTLTCSKAGASGKTTIAAPTSTIADC